MASPTGDWVVSPCNRASWDSHCRRSFSSVATRTRSAVPAPDRGHTAVATISSRPSRCRATRISFPRSWGGRGRAGGTGPGDRNAFRGRPRISCGWYPRSCSAAELHPMTVSWASTTAVAALVMSRGPLKSVLCSVFHAVMAPHQPRSSPTESALPGAGTTAGDHRPAPTCSCSGPSCGGGPARMSCTDEPAEPPEPAEPARPPHPARCGVGGSRGRCGRRRVSALPVFILKG